ncbi:hypothetical protein [Amaricoccus tamworthensis]|uniref:hypothetical protein n=1 Tax=Amaricoccus tamworthensis TaxID=57002 RepID=UPI003C7E6050
MSLAASLSLERISPAVGPDLGRVHPEINETSATAHANRAFDLKNRIVRLTFTVFQLLAEIVAFLSRVNQMPWFFGGM